MKSRTYNIISTTSLMVIAVCALLSDRFSGYGWYFGGAAGIFTLISAWLYLAHGMRRDREKSATQTGSSNSRNTRGGRLIIEARSNLLNRPVAEMCSSEFDENMVRSDSSADLLREVSEKATEVRETFVASVKTLQFGTLYMSPNYIVPLPQRTFAEEVLEIVKGLAELHETPKYELELKADGTLRVLPCQQSVARAEQEKRVLQKQLQGTLDAPDSSDLAVN